MKNKKSQSAGRQGFSIVELLIYIGLLAILMVIMTRVFTSIIDVQLSSEATGSVEEDGRYIYSRVAYDIDRASGVVTPANAGDISNSLTLLIDGMANTYTLVSGNLMLENALGLNQLNSVGTNVSNLSFQKIANSIQIKFTISSTTQQINGPDTKNIETTVALR